MTADVDALNYPYIRIRSVDWLKRTLLIFPHVVRMTPARGAPADDPEVAPFAEIDGRRAPLLRSAAIHSSYVHDAQRDLVKELQTRLDTGGPGFLERFGRDAARTLNDNSIGNKLTVWERRLSEVATFQIHSHKLFADLTEFLQRTELAWWPESYLADGKDYLEMHPQLGEAVMATLAVACAENEGLQVVTEFPGLHGKIIGTPREKILTSCLDGSRPSGRTTGQQIAEFLVYRRCNVDMLSADNITALKGEREALADFRAKLDELAKSLPPTIVSEPHLEERVKDTLSEMFREWEESQVNLGSVGRQFFGSGVFTEAGKIAQKMVEAALRPETVNATIAGATAAGVVGASASPTWILPGAGAGFVVALVFRGLESWRSARDAAKRSPLRYLTRLQEQGVAFSVSR